MGADVCELVVYTQNGAVTFQVKACLLYTSSITAKSKTVF